MPLRWILRMFGRAAAGALFWAQASTMRGADALPPPPAIGLGSLVQQLAQAKPAAAEPDKAAMLRPEFQFKPQANWVFLPEIARQLSSKDAERAAIRQLLEQGSDAARKALAVEGADHDVVVATTLFLTQLWGVARQQEVSEAAVDAFHAQLVTALSGDSVGAIAKMSDADKQKYWEYCVGIPVFVLGIKDIAKDAASQQSVRQFANMAFTTLFGAGAEHVTFSDKGIQLDPASPAARANTGSAPAASNSAPAPSSPASNGPTVRLRYTPPAGWTQENAGWATIFRSTVLDRDSRGQVSQGSQGRHAATILVLQPRDRNPDMAAGFGAVWREQLDGFDLGNAFPHYRSRLKSGLVVNYMGRFLHRKVHQDQDLRTYAVMYLVELGGGKVQPVVGILVPKNPDMGMLQYKEQAAFGGFADPLFNFLNSIEPEGGPAPSPAGAMFQPWEFVGNWTTSSQAYGGSYVNASTGANAGIAYHTAGGNFLLGQDGHYDYNFAFVTSSPVTGGARGSTKHSGTYRIDGDTVAITPSQKITDRWSCCAVGVGEVLTNNGRKRMLMTVGFDGSGQYRAPQIIPNWDYYEGTMTWYYEK